MELEDSTPVKDGSRVVKAQELSLGNLGRCIGEMMSTKDIRVRHMEALHLVVNGLD